MTPKEHAAAILREATGAAHIGGYCCASLETVIAAAIQQAVEEARAEALAEREATELRAVKPGEIARDVASRLPPRRMELAARDKGSDGFAAWLAYHIEIAIQRALNVEREAIIECARERKGYT